MDPISSFAHFFKSGGPFMYAILAVGVVIMAFVAERFWVIGRTAAFNATKFTNDVVSRLAKGDVAGATEMCRRSRTPVAQVTHAVISRADADEDRMQNAADGAAMVALPPLSRRLPYLNMLANVSTLLGLLGTIFGLITAFSAVDAADPSQRSAFLARGISEALNTTAFGLIVAVPTLLLHGFLVSKVEAVVEAVDQATVRVIDALSRRSQRAA